MLIPVNSWTSESGRPWRDMARAISLSSSEIWWPTMGHGQEKENGSDNVEGVNTITTHNHLF